MIARMKTLIACLILSGTSLATAQEKGKAAAPTATVEQDLNLLCKVAGDVLKAEKDPVVYGIRVAQRMDKEGKNAEVRKMMALPEVLDSFAKQGLEPSTMTSEQLGSYIKAESTKWASVLKNAKVKKP